MTTTDPGTGLHGETIADPSGAHVAMRDGDTAFFGHPRGLGFLAGTELWERFSFYGMQALLMLYMTKFLLVDGRSHKVVGLDTYRSVLERVFGPMTDLALAAQTFGLYSGLILLTPLLGAYLGDRVLGRTKTITIGALLMSAGHLTMASEHLFLLALLLLIVGGGCFIANLTAQVGGLYHPTDTRRTRAFGIYLMALNVGALASPLIVGTLGERVGFHWGFAAAGIGMLIGLATYLYGRRYLPPDRVARGEKAPPLTGAQWVTVGALLATFIPRLLFNAAAQQAYGIMVVWADTAVDRTIGGFELPVTWVLTADGVLTILGVLAANRLWAWQATRGREPADLVKMGIANTMVAVAFIIIGLLAAMAKVPIVGWLAFYLVLDFSYAWYDPPSKALIARFAPPSVNGTMFALSSASSALGFFLLGWLGRFYEPLGASRYFLLTAALPAATAIGLFIFARPILRVLERGEADTLAEEPAAGQPFPA
jgi:POT family proton-dependent oligopeptide transporter